MQGKSFLSNAVKSSIFIDDFREFKIFENVYKKGNKITSYSTEEDVILLQLIASLEMKRGGALMARI